MANRVANLEVVPAKLRPPVLSRDERMAYQAAHRILFEVTDYGERQLACPGALRSRRVDAIAKIILDSFK